jgi:hypothetical protein
VILNSGVTLSNAVNIPNDGVFIGGYGTLAPTTPQGITIQAGTVITGGTGTAGQSYPTILTGNAIGTLTFGSSATVTFAQGGGLQFSIMNDSGAPGTDFSLINVSGSLVIDSSTATTPFSIQVVGIDGPGPYDGSNTPNTFNFGIAHTWTLLSAGTITDPSGGFNAADFTVEATSTFNGPGNWSVSQVGNDLDLDFTPVPEPSTWALIAGGLAVVGLAGWRRSQPTMGK